MDNLAPIVLFVYKRPELTKRVIESIQHNPEACRSVLIVYSDAAKSEKDRSGVQQVRDLIKKIEGFKDVQIVLRENNLGLAESFIQGISEVLDDYEEAIFLEDDNLCSSHFLNFMNVALQKYKHNGKVSCVTGYSFPLIPQVEKPYFLKGADTWSMGTWRRAWAVFERDGRRILEQLKEKNLTREFQLDGFRFLEMLNHQIQGRIDSWGVRWLASAFINDMYCLYPERPFAVNIGYGKDSIHCHAYDPLFRKPVDLANYPIGELPGNVEVEVSVFKRVQRMNSGGTYKQIKKFVNRAASKIERLLYSRRELT